MVAASYLLGLGGTTLGKVESRVYAKVTEGGVPVESRRKLSLFAGKEGPESGGGRPDSGSVLVWLKLSPDPRLFFGCGNR